MTAPQPATRMIGRSVELEVLLDAMSAGSRGEPRAVIVRGEAGIGKTRLITEFLDRITARESDPPVVIATGQCIDLGPIGAPFTPIRRVLHDILSVVGQEEFTAAAGSAAVVTTLGRLMPDLAAAEGHESSDRGDYVAEAIERVLEVLSRTRHVVIVIEDLHWADSATLALLKTLATTLRGEHLTLVATYRSDDVGRGHPLRAVLAELERRRSVVFAEVPRLDREGVAALAREHTGAGLADARVEVLLERSEGVPFFIEELIDLPKGPMPPTLRDVVLARYFRLGDIAQEVAGVAAVGGVRVDHATLEAVWSGSVDDLRRGVREAVAEGAIVADATGYAFRHALIREAVEEDLLPSVRGDLHRAYASVLQRAVDSGDSAVAAATAEHWLAARDNHRAFASTVIARSDAHDRLAYETEARLGERLLELWPNVTDAEELAQMSRASLYVAVVETHLRLGASRSGLRMVERALAVTDTADTINRAHLHVIGSYLASVHEGDDASLRHATAAESLLDGVDGPQAKSLLARAISSRAMHVPLSEAQALVDRARVIAEESADDTVKGHLLMRQSNIHAQLGRYEEALQEVQRAQAMVTSEPSLELTSINNTVDLLVRMGRWDDAIAVGKAGVSRAHEVGLERGGGSWILANVAEAEVNAGRPWDAVQHARRCLALYGAEHRGWTSYALRVHAIASLWLDEIDEVEPLFERGGEVGSHGFEGDYEQNSLWCAVRADAALAHAHDLTGTARADAIRDAQRLAMILDEDEALDMPDFVLPLVQSGARALAAAVDHDIEVEPQLREAIDRVVAATPRNDWTRPSLALVTAYLAQVDGSDDIIMCWRDAAEFSVGGRQPRRHIHEARYRLGLALLDDGQRDEGMDQLRVVAREAPDDGANLVARWARDAMRHTRRDGTPTGALAELTPREHEVLALVAQGLSNGEIGKRLFISAKTASVHVSSILAKLGASNRAEAASVYASVARTAD